MKNLLLLLILSVGFSVIAQVDSPTSYSSYFTLSASRYEPGNLGEDHEKFEIAIVNAYAWFANTSLDVASITKLTDQKENYLSDSQLNAIFDKMGDRTRIGFGATVDYFNMMYKFTNPEGEERFTIGIGMADRAEANMSFSNNFFRLLYFGNKQFENQTVPFPVGASFFYTREHTVSAAVPLPIKSEDWHFRLGARLKYIRGIEGMYTERGDMSLFTQEHGQSVTANYDYAFHSSIDFREDNYSFNPSKAKGKGFGADLGISGTYKDRWHGNINVLDMGSVTFKGAQNLTYRKAGSYQFNGLFFDDIIDENRFNTDSVVTTAIDEFTEGNEFEGEDFSMPYPTRMRLHISYRIPKENKKGHTYYPHIVGINLTQGFRNLGSSITRTYVAGSYTFNLNDIFEVGTNVGVLGYNKMEFGAFMAVKLGFFRMGLGSGNITPLIRSFGTGADFNFNMTLAF